MPFATHRRHHHTTTTTTARPYRRSIFSRRTPRTTRAPRVHHQRKPTLKDKVSGALLKLRGSLTRRPGVKAAGTRRMRGTDGRGSHVRRRRFL
ncbi:hypothetical protein H0G86_012491 [Trichoderma simmonsii]|uniref:Uncharacterized protein n=1 Tax=Trichoderma simmonsii TaxID=1491479 RepID=A0A8G0PM28_9HYPO|nr:hypothetical protein H0G86_012491 [Trichoderma simmonsii]